MTVQLLTLSTTKFEPVRKLKRTVGSGTKWSVIWGRLHQQNLIPYLVKSHLYLIVT